MQRPDYCNKSYTKIFMSQEKAKLPSVPARVHPRLEGLRHIAALDYIRAFAILHIVLYHYYLEYFQGSFLIVPEGIGANLPRLEVFKDGGIIGLIKNIFSFVFVYGFTSVNLFLVLSGFVLTFSLLNHQKSGQKFTWISYLWKRLKRILIPFYISVFLGIGFLYLRNFLFPQFAAAPIFDLLDIVKLFIPPFIFFDIQFVQKFNGDYWFIPLILQLYLIFPFLYMALKKIGVKKFLIAAFLIAAAYRYIAAFYLDSVPMGVIYPAANSYRLFSFFLPRLFEFCLGMGLAKMQFEKSTFLESISCRWCVFTGMILAFSGFVLDTFRLGWAVSDLVSAAGLFILFLGISRKIDSRKKAAPLSGGPSAVAQAGPSAAGFLKKVSDSSYEIFLLHHYFLNYFLVPLLVTLQFRTETSFWLLMPVFVVAVCLTGEIGRRISVFMESFFIRRPG